ncbi:MAG: hypothetical protein M1813_009832 [Trichoglossum hirsutum]|nr:MAG: hypothetical protein M1813_009832 [Trichoglossum hirsutum]
MYLGSTDVPQIILRSVQAFCTLLILALVGNMVHEATHGNPSVVNYQIFVGAFSFLSLIYLFPSALTDRFRYRLVTLVLDALNTLFFFAGGVALAARLGVHSCGNQAYLKLNKVTNGADNMSKRCHEAQAATAFLWFGFAAYLVSAILSSLGAKGSGANLRGMPSMSQSRV